MSASRSKAIALHVLVIEPLSGTSAVIVPSNCAALALRVSIDPQSGIGLHACRAVWAHIYYATKAGSAVHAKLLLLIGGGRPESDSVLPLVCRCQWIKAQMPWT